MVLPKTHRLHAPAPPAEVARRARQLVLGPPSQPDGPVRGGEARGDCIGTVGEGTFDLRRTTRRGRAGLTRALGSFSAEGSGTAILIRYRPAATTLLLLVTLSLSTVAAGAELAGRREPPRLVDLVAATGVVVAFLLTLLQVAWDRAHLQRLLGGLSGDGAGPSRAAGRQE